jgi:hypothetical protein
MVSLESQLEREIQADADQSSFSFFPFGTSPIALDVSNFTPDQETQPYPSSLSLIGFMLTILVSVVDDSHAHVGRSSLYISQSSPSI